jgi:hypothetical protein
MFHVREGDRGGDKLHHEWGIVGLNEKMRRGFNKKLVNVHVTDERSDVCVPLLFRSAPMPSFHPFRSTNSRAFCPLFVGRSVIGR